MTATSAPTGADSILSVHDLSIDFQRRDGVVRAVRNVSFDLRRGEILGLVGESGSGKSTVLSALLGLLPPAGRVTTGTATYDGQDLLALTERRMRQVRGARIALIPQRPMTSLSPITTLRRQLGWYESHGRRPGAVEGDDALLEMLDQIGLRAAHERLNGYPHEFSGGQMQRLLIGVAALLHHPDILLADEPTTTLDVTVQSQVVSVLQGLRESRHLSIIFVTHDLGVVAQLCDRIGVMYGGRLVEVATAEELFEAPRHPYTRALLDALPSRRARGERMRAIPGTAHGANGLGGCPFAPRCPDVLPVCVDSPLPRFTFGDAEVACHLPGART